MDNGREGKGKGKKMVGEKERMRRTQTVKGDCV